MNALSNLITARKLDLKAGPKATLKELIIYGGENGEAWPSYQTLADSVGCDRRTAIRHVNLLEDLGYIKRTLKPWRNGGFKAYFTIRFDAINKATKAVVTKMRKTVETVVTKCHKKVQIIKEKEREPAPQSSRPTATRRENRPLGLDFDPKHGAPGQKAFEQNMGFERNPNGQGFSSVVALLGKLNNRLKINQ